MAALDFPTSPLVNDIYTANGKSYKWDGTSWLSLTGGTFSSTNDTSTNATYYPLSASAAGGYNAITSSTRLTFNPSTGTLSATLFTSLSDEEQKVDIENIVTALDTICKLRGVSFKWKDTESKSYGVVAQEVEKVIPEIVIQADDNKTVNYNAIIGFLIEAIKELSNRVVKLESK